jgi:hypothetical protein
LPFEEEMLEDGGNMYSVVIFVAFKFLKGSFPSEMLKAPQFTKCVTILVLV